MLKYLKKIRVIISLLFFLLTTFIFLDYNRIVTDGLIDSILFLQFVPSFIKFVNLFSLAAFGFIVVFILSLFFGRIYCSTICPFGILQDIISWF
ncbi:4Fe-4S binding protein, partial [Bacteroidota bacterium]